VEQSPLARAYVFLKIRQLNFARQLQVIMAETVSLMSGVVEQVVEKTLFKVLCELGFSGQTLC
jgi:hypothetical protein